MRDIKLAQSAGFCFGVQRAVEQTLEIQKKYNKKIYTLGPLIHNNDVVKMLEDNNIFSLSEEELESVSEGDVVVIRSHGVGKSTIELLLSKKLEVINATCPYVTNIQKKVNKYNDLGYKIIIVGDKNHPEVIGINGWCNNSAMVTKNGDFDDEIPAKVCVVSQTTEKLNNWKSALSVINSNAKEVLAFNTICSATEVRQKSAEDLSKQVDLMIVIGGKNSSNTTKLYQICKANCENTIHIENAEELTDDIINNLKYEKIGITAGASTPDWIIKEVIGIMNIESKEILNDQLQMMEQSDRKIKVGDVIEEKILSISSNEVVVELTGHKVDGIIPLNELSTDEDKREYLKNLKPGDYIKAIVIKLKNEDNNVVLSRIELEKEDSVNELEAAFNNKSIVSIKIKEVVSGGLVGTYKGIRVFVPASHVSINFVNNLDDYVGKELEVKIVEFVKAKTNKIVASRKVILEQEKETRENDRLNTLAVGDIVEGVVRRFTSFGAFVDIGGIDALIHISELSWGKINNPSDVLKIDEKVTAKIISLDKENKKISLSLKALTDNPWNDVEEKYPEGFIVLGKVARLNDFGAFIELEPGVDGLAHISKLSFNKVSHPSEVLKIGEQVKAKILSVDKENKRIGLSIKDV